MSAAAAPRGLSALFIRPGWAVIASCAMLAIIGLLAIFGPLFLGLGNDVSPSARLKPPSEAHWFGTDGVGRDIFVRTISGSRNSVLIGLATAALAMLLGTALGVIAGFSRTADLILMRIADGLMAIPAVLLAIAMVSVLGGGFLTVIIAIAVPEIPRTARLMRAVVLSIRQLPFIAAAVAVGSSAPKILFRHILPNAVGAMTVQATFVCASAVLSEAALGFLGVGTPPDIPSWGNTLANGRQFFQLAPWIILFPGLMLSALVLSINILGDHLRDRLDPRLVRRGAS